MMEVTSSDCPDFFQLIRPKIVPPVGRNRPYRGVLFLSTAERLGASPGLTRGWPRDGFILGSPVRGLATSLLLFGQGVEQKGVAVCDFFGDLVARSAYPVSVGIGPDPHLGLGVFGHQTSCEFGGMPECDSVVV